MRANQLTGWLLSFLLGAAAVFVVTTNMYGDLAHPSLVIAELCVLALVHLIRYQRVWFSRELLLNIVFLAYALLSVSWTDNARAAFVTVPALITFTIVLALFSALTALHNLRAVLSGMAFGFGVAAVVYTLTQRFPFAVPPDFSYNTIAAMYLFGLFITATSGAYAGRRIVPLVTGLILVLLIAATTSIKTNLGAALGIASATVLYFRPSVGRVVRTLLVLGTLAGAIAYAIGANHDLSERLTNGYGRVALGVSVLTNRENDTGSTGLGTREGWKREGLKGWVASPVFGHGVEAFRSDFGITSHSTPIDLLYNSGAIGCGLFYAMLASLAWRLWRARNAALRPVRARLTAALVAYAFISLSGILYYDPFLAMFIGIASGILMRTERQQADASATAPSARQPPAPDAALSRG